MKLVYCSANIYLLLYISHFLLIISCRHLKHTADKCTCAWEFKKPFIFCFITLRCIQAKINEQFPSVGKYWTKNWENFVLEKIEITILGKYWEILRVHSTCLNFFGIWEMFFQKWENIGNRVVKCVLIFPVQKGTVGKVWVKNWMNQVEVTVELNRHLEERKKAEWPGGREGHSSLFPHAHKNGSRDSNSRSEDGFDSILASSSQN